MALSWSPVMDAVYLGLFVSAFLAPTLLPLPSEPAVAAALLAGHDVAAVLAVASVANVLGSCVNYVLGRLVERLRRRRWFPVRPDMMARAQGWYGRFGYWSLLLSWAPVVGDPLTLVAGVMREPAWRFLLLVTAAKVGRYLVLAAVVLKWA